MTRRSFEELESDFEFLDDWEDRYKYVIELGKELAPFDDAFKSAEYKVNGCVSQVWIKSTFRDDGGSSPRMSFIGDSDALIVKGLIAIVASLLSDRHVDEIAKTDAKAALTRLGLHDHLSPQRSNGLAAMVARIKSDAEQALLASNVT
ncbi:MAG: SufE family protein [Aestuariivirgaceae bacterium]